MRLAPLAIALTLSLGIVAHAAAATISVGDIAAQSLGLGEERVFTATVRAADDFRGGDVNIDLDRAALDALDPAGDIDVSVEPTYVNLAPGGSAEVSVKIVSRTTAPDFANGMFQLIATEAADATNTMAADVTLNVAAVYEIRLFGGGNAPERWSSPMTVQFRRHVGGVRVKFVNYDTQRTHIIHGQGAIPHGDTTRPLAMSQNGMPGGEYMVNVTNQQAVTGQYYCHDHEAGGNRRTLMFNAL